MVKVLHKFSYINKNLAITVWKRKIGTTIPQCIEGSCRGSRFPYINDLCSLIVGSEMTDFAFQ